MEIEGQEKIILDVTAGARMMWFDKSHPNALFLDYRAEVNPDELAEYLIKTYTAEGDTVLDCCMGVGWSAVASKRLNRNFIGIDINSDYVATTRKRVDTIPSRLEAFASVCEKESEKK